MLSQGSTSQTLTTLTSFVSAVAMASNIVPVFCKMRFARASTPEELIHADLIGPIETRSLGGAYYCLVLRDDFTGYRIAYYIAKKSDTFESLQRAFRQILRDTGHCIQILCSDRGGEFTSKVMKDYLE